jgi:hypothetical protein
VGVGNSGKPLKRDRIRSHSNRGWKTYKKWNFSEGSFALDIERDCLLIIRNDLGIVPYLSREQMPQGGWTETFSDELLSLPDAAKLVSELMKNKAKKKSN